MMHLSGQNKLPSLRGKHPPFRPSWRTGQGMLSLFVLVGLLKGGVDYLYTQTFHQYTNIYCSPEQARVLMESTQPIPMELSTLLYAVVIQSLGIAVSLVIGIRAKAFGRFVDALPIAGSGTYISENLYFVFLNVFGALNGCYGWYTGNPLNPDDRFGYGWTNRSGMVGYFLDTMMLYGGIYLVCKSAMRIRAYLKEKRAH